MNDARNSTQSDDIPNAGPSEQELLDAVMKSSPIMDELDIPLPSEEDTAQDPEESDEYDQDESDEAVSEEEEEVEESEESDVEADDESTQTDVMDFDDLDLDAKIAVKIDGEDSEISFGDLVKGYQTDAHLSKKGRELSEATKAFESERAEKLAEVETLAEASSAILMGAEQAKAKEYHDLETAIKKARDEGDTYELGELKDKREQAQGEYWKARKNREGMQEKFQAAKVEEQNKAFQGQLEHFQAEIPNLIPDFDDKVAASIRDFAVAEGIDTTLLDSVVDPVVVKFIDDYRRLKNGVNKGKAKRKAAPAKKAVPARKGKPAEKKASDKAKMTKARAFKEDASKDDQMAFLRDFASKSLGNIK